MKLLLIMIIVLIVFIPYSAKEIEYYKADQINGVWITDAKDAEVQVYRVGNIYYGKIIWLKEMGANGKPLLDNLHPNPKLRHRTRVNIVALSGLVCAGGKNYENGVLYYPTNGKTYRCNATLLNQNELELRIFVGFKLLGKTTVFTRAS